MKSSPPAMAKMSFIQFYVIFKIATIQLTWNADCHFKGNLTLGVKFVVVQVVDGLNYDGVIRVRLENKQSLVHQLFSQFKRKILTFSIMSMDKPETVCPPISAEIEVIVSFSAV